MIAAIKTTVRKNAFGEYVARLYIDGKHQSGDDYFASDKDDALSTASEMLEHAQAQQNIDAITSKPKAKKTTYKHKVDGFVFQRKTSASYKYVVIINDDSVLSWHKNTKNAQASISKDASARKRSQGLHSPQSYKIETINGGE